MDTFLDQTTRQTIQRVVLSYKTKRDAVIEDHGITEKEFKSSDATNTASGVFMATARFHHPAHAKEWASPTINQEFDIVWNLILSGILK
jgi:hypothetical protein